MARKLRIFAIILVVFMVLAFIGLSGAIVWAHGHDLGHRHGYGHHHGLSFGLDVRFPFFHSYSPYRYYPYYYPTYHYQPPIVYQPPSIYRYSPTVIHRVTEITIPSDYVKHRIPAHLSPPAEAIGIHREVDEYGRPILVFWAPIKALK
ncbi:MAG: hypothetical protein PHQ47_00575 [Candidatus Portnoybacteria bacterium]|nr:hypothetical protein [Candidatus Portnoybacteria bacterium]